MLHRQPLGVASRHCAAIRPHIQASHHQRWAQHQIIAPSAIGLNIKASRHQHWAQHQGIALSAIRFDIEASHSQHQARQIEALRHQPLGAISKRCTTSHQAWHEGIALPSGANLRHCTTIGGNIKASHRQPSGAKSSHHATIRREIKALRHQPLGTKSKHRAASHRVQHQALRHHWALIPSITPTLGASSRNCATIRRDIEVSRRQPSGAT